jgi:hypothetical protein
LLVHHLIPLKFYRGQLNSLDNRPWGPYNPSLSLRHNAHINEPQS